MSEKTAKHTTWHVDGARDDSNLMVHPSDGEAWKHIDQEYPEFAKEKRNIRLSLATNGFTPFHMTSASYSCWPAVFIIPYNLPPHMCMKENNILLSLVIPEPEHPGKNLNVFFQPLIDELLLLFEEGVMTYDSNLKQNFKLHALLLWTIHDFLAYGMVACWSTHGRLACPCCYGDTKSFLLRHGRKPCWFDCHRRFLPPNHEFRKSLKGFRINSRESNGPPKHLTGDEVYAQMQGLVPDETGKSTYEGFGKTHNWLAVSGLWQLPYFSKLLVRHNIDVMHNEKNFAEALFNTCLDIPGKTKDNVKARLDMMEICDRPTLKLSKKPNGQWQKPRANFCVSKDDKMKILKWFGDLKLPDQFAANLRRYVNLVQCRLIGLKSHDFHIMMERLLPVALRGFIPEKEWKVVAELSYFYRQLCAKELDPQCMRKLEEQIPILLCKLENMFPPGFFNVMQNLIVHLPYEARVGGPVSYRWMYSIER